MNILYVFENDLQKPESQKSVIFKENEETRFCLNMEVERKETKTIVYKKIAICQYSTRLITPRFLL